MNAATDDIFTDLERLRLPGGQIEALPEAAPAAVPRPAKGKRNRGEFLKGPIPLPWLTAASMLPGKGPLAVALAVWFEAGRRKSSEVRLTTAVLKRFNVNRKAKYAALKALEKAGLVRVHRVARKNPVVTLLDVGGDREGNPEQQGDDLE